MTSDFQKKIDSLSKKISSSIAEKKIRASVSKKSKDVIKLPKIEALAFPVVGEDVFLAPNSLLRGALFSAKKLPKKRNYVENEIRASLSNYSISFTGEELDQRDLTVWMTCIKSFEEDKKNNINFIPHRAFKMMGVSPSQKNYEFILASLKRLEKANVGIVDHKLGLEYSGHLISESLISRPEIDGKRVLKNIELNINSKIAEMFMARSWTGLPLSIDNQFLAGLETWLFRFYQSHDKPIDYSVSKLNELSGINDKNLAKFKYKLKIALGKVCDVNGWYFEITKNNLVKIKKG
ncbi:hypothetical protein [Morganella morganii]|uniref:hypothetical protein n=1 Tax=Morganella morganii TaxID=582 RepID=UPI0004686A40|nr:hypothetical protein [Morganella morganii]